jgi:hypothetical protein
MPNPDTAAIQLDQAPQLLNDRQVAFVLDTTLSEVRLLRGRRILPFIRFGGEFLTKTEAVRDLCRARSLRRKKTV